MVYKGSFILGFFNFDIIFILVFKQDRKPIKLSIQMKRLIPMTYNL